MTLDQPVADAADVQANDLDADAAGRPALTATRRQHRPLPRLRPTMGLVAYLFTVVMLGGTIPTPLYPLYAAHLELTPLLITVIFAAYACGTLATLLFFGRLSDQVGRAPVLGGALGVAAISTLLFLFWPSLVGLLLGRALSGVSVGLVTGTATAYLAELDRQRARAALVATVANMGGLGLGPLLSGLLAQYGGDPLRLPYLVFLGLLLPATAVVLMAPATAPSSSPKAVHLGFQRLTVPASIREPFVVAGAAAFAAFAVLGLFTSLVGQFLGQGLHTTSPALSGLVVFALFAAATLAQVVALRLTHRVALLAGVSCLPVGLALTVLALPTTSLGLLVAGVVAGGVGVGLAFKAGLTLVGEIAPADRRAEVVSSFFVAAYAGITLPVVGVGILLTFLPLLDAALIFAVLVTAIAVGAGVLGARSRALLGANCRCPGATDHG